MKTGIIGDIHGNIEALETVLSALDAAGIDEIVCVGDVVGYGADPMPCVQRVRARARVVVAGNHDYAAVKKLPLDYFNAAARAAAMWTAEQLDDAARWWLSNLPLVHVEERFQLVHSSLADPEAFDYIFNPEEAAESFGKQVSPITFFGHTHWPATFIDGEPVTHSLQRTLPTDGPEKLMINVGSVGQPRDSNPQASFAVFDDADRQVELHRIDYDVDRAARKIRAAGLPVMLAERLRSGY